MFQLYHHGDRGWVGELLARVEASGYLAVALTVDVQLYGRRERDILARWSPRKAMEIAPNPRGPTPEYQARLTWDDRSEERRVGKECRTRSEPRKSKSQRSRLRTPP